MDEVPYSLRNPEVDEGWSFPGPERALLQPMSSGERAPLSIHPLLLGGAFHANPNTNSRQQLVPHPWVSS